mgnify:CR=1 FL=1
MIEDPRGRIDYAESGDGATLVLLPGSCSTGAAWRPVISELGLGFRRVTTSLPGYGGTAERRTEWDSDISFEAEALEAVIRHAGCPVHLVGHSFGGLVSLAVALRRRAALASLTIIEAPAPDLLRQKGEFVHYRAFRQMTEAYFRAFHAGEPDAIEMMIDFYGGAGTYAAWPERLRNYAMATTPVNILDWASAYGFTLSPATLAKVQVQTLILIGGNSHPAVSRANELLGHCIPRAAVVTLPGAAHFMIATHARDVAGLIAHHVASIEATNRPLAAARR